MNENKKTGILGKIYIAVLLLFFYFPIIYTIVFSFNNSKSLSVFGGFSLRWYQKMLNDSSMINAIFYTFLVAVIATAVSTIAGTITAIGLSGCRRVLRTAVEQINSLPILNPDIVTAIGLLMFFSTLAIKKGLATLLLAHIMFCIPFVILSIMPKIRTLDPNLADAAMDLGCTPFQALIKVIVPQIMPGIISGALIAFTMSFDDFIISYFVTGNGVNNISILVYTMSKRINPSINALSTVIIVIITIGLIIANILPAVKSKRTKRRIKAAIAVAAAAIAVIIPLSAYKSGPTLKIYNTGEYIGEHIIENFEDEYGVKIVYETFDSNETMYTKLQSGESYDVLIPSDYMIERLIKENALQKLDKSKLPNLELLAEDVKNKDYDENMDYSVPYFYGNVGIVYNKNNVPRELLEEQGWNILKNTDYKGRVYIYDSQRDAFMVALKALGYSMNTDNLDEIQAANDWLMELNSTMEPAYVTDEVIDNMKAGNKDLAIVYSGDAAYILSENENMGYFVPMEGTNTWYDAMVIPADAENPNLAHEFINYILSYDASYDNTETVGYTSTNQEVRDEMFSEGGDFYGNEAYIPRSGYKYDEVFHDNETLREELNKRWDKIKSAE